MHDPDRPADGRHMHLGERAPAAANRIEDFVAERRRQTLPQHVVDRALGGRKALRQQRLDRQRAERQTHPSLANLIIERLRHFQAAPAHVADGPDRAEEAGDDAERPEARLFRAGEDANFEPGFRQDRLCELRPVGGAPDRLGAGRVDLRHPHRIRDGAKAPEGLDRAAEIVRLDRAGLGELLAEAAERLLVEARNWRAPELVIDHEPHRIRANVHDRIGRAAEALGPFRIEIERALRFTPPCGGVLGHGASLRDDHGRDGRIWPERGGNARSRGAESIWQGRKIACHIVAIRHAAFGSRHLRALEESRKVAAHGLLLARCGC